MPSLAAATPLTFIITRDAAKARAFYADTLGLNFVRQDAFATVFDLAGASLRVSEVADFQPAQHSVLGWQVNDIAATVRALVAKGITFTVYDGLGQDDLGIWIAPDIGDKVAWFKDPDGNVLSLTQSAN